MLNQPWPSSSPSTTPWYPNLPIKKLLADSNDHNNGHDLKALQKLWYSKLADDGFDDIENVNHAEMPLKTWHSQKWQNRCKTRIELTQEYYRRARDLLNTYSFNEPIHRTIWELHSEGLSKRKIEKAISSSPTPYKREAIGVIINIIAVTIK